MIFTKTWFNKSNGKNFSHKNKIRNIAQEKLYIFCLKYILSSCKTGLSAKHLRNTLLSGHLTGAVFVNQQNGLANAWITFFIWKKRIYTSFFRSSENSRSHWRHCEAVDSRLTPGQGSSTMYESNIIQCNILTVQSQGQR